MLFEFEQASIFVFITRTVPTTRDIGWNLDHEVGRVTRGLSTAGVVPGRLL